MPALDPRADIDAIAAELSAELVDFRRDLHAHPELGRQEHRTTSKVIERLRAAGLGPRVLPTGTGVICDVSDGGTPALAFRADMDALPVPDLTTTSYRSTVDGVSHACGHDVHTTVGLGAALVLARLVAAGVPIQPTRFVFQPAEEVTPGGALDVLAAGELEGVTRAYAFHCDPRLAVGQIGLRVGAITAGADGILVTLRGPGGHTARPHLTADLVYALGALLTGLPGAMSRLTDPRAGLSVVWGQVHAGAAQNAIPQTGFAEGTIRCLDAATWETAHRMVPELVKSLMGPYGVDVEVEARTSVPPCTNDAAAVDAARAAALGVVGEEGVVPVEQSLGGEDFAWIANLVPSALLRLGVRGPGVVDAGDLHQGALLVDEDAIGIGVRTFARLALDQ